MKPIWKILIAVAVIVAVVAILFIVPHYRAKAAVNAYRAQLKRQGEKTTIAELVPALSAEESKIGRDVVPAAGQLGNFTNTPPMMKWLAPGHVLVGWSEPVAATEYSSNCWPTMVEIAAKHRADSEALVATLQGQAMGFPVNYAAGLSALLRHLAPLKHASLWLSGEALLAMHEGNTNVVWENLRAEANLLRMNHSEPLLISQLVRFAIVSIAVDTLWEGLQFRGWNEAQLAELQTNWEAFDLMDHVESSFAMERVMGAIAFADMRKSFSNYNDVANPSFLASSSPRYDSLGQVLTDPAEGAKAHLHYRAWKSWGSYEEELATMQVWQAAMEATRRMRTNNAFVTERDNFLQVGTNILKSHPGWEKRFVFAGNSLLGFGEDGMHGVVSKFLLKAANAENERRMAVTVIALERFHLRHGQYPAQLPDLVPELLARVPIDLMDGKPLRYRLRDDGTFLLYSVGEDGKDDGGDGSPPPGDTSTSKVWFKMRNAVWPAPATPDEVKKYEAEVQEKLIKKPPGKLVPPLSVPAPTRAPTGTNSSKN